jgi:GT2 family glycosyltransferase
MSGTAWPAKLIVVDQGSGRHAARWLEELDARGIACRYIASSETGIAAATNRGLEAVDTPFVAVTHDDCRVAPDWLATLSRRVRLIGVAVLTGRVEPEGPGVAVTVVTSRKPVTYTHPLVDGDVLFPPNMGFPMRVLERVGFLDEHPSLFFAGEDSEWAYRCLRAGIPIVYDPDVMVGHLAWQTKGDLPAIYRRYATGQGAFYGKYLLQRDAFIALRAARDLARGPWLLLRGAVTRNDELLAMGRGEVIGIPLGIVRGMRGRRR